MPAASSLRLLAWVSECIEQATRGSWCGGAYRQLGAALDVREMLLHGGRGLRGRLVQRARRHLLHARPQGVLLPQHREHCSTPGVRRSVKKTNGAVVGVTAVPFLEGEEVWVGGGPAIHPVPQLPEPQLP
jgi:hypothetical protein